jgi:hypothetical protein
MQVFDLAQDLNVAPEGLVLLLRELGIHVSSAESPVTEADVSRVLARIERERRAGHKDIREALEAAIEDAQSAHRPRRRRRRAARKKAEEPALQEVSADGEDAVPSDETAEAAEGGEAVEESEPGASDEAREDGEQAEPQETEPQVDPVEEMEGEAGAGETVEEGEGSEPEDEGGRAASEKLEDEDLMEGEDFEELAAEGDEEVYEEEDILPAPKPEPVRRAAPEGPARVIRKPVSSSPAASAAPGGQVRIQAEGYTSDGRRKSKKEKKGKKRQRVDQDAVQSNIQRVMAKSVRNRSVSGPRFV